MLVDAWLPFQWIILQTFHKTHDLNKKLTTKAKVRPIGLLVDVTFGCAPYVCLKVHFLLSYDELILLIKYTAIR